MQTLTLRPELRCRTRVAAVFAGLILIGFLALGVHGASATSLISTGQIDADNEVTASEPLSSVMLVNNRLTRSQILFLEENFVLPVYIPGSEQPEVPVTQDVYDLGLPWSDSPNAY